MPRIGCGLAGGKWEKAEPLLRETLPGTQIFVYDLPSGGGVMPALARIS
jgi:hypothetical protein